MNKYIIEKAMPLLKNVVKRVKVNQYNADFTNDIAANLNE